MAHGVFSFSSFFIVASQVKCVYRYVQDRVQSAIKYRDSSAVTTTIYNRTQCEIAPLQEEAIRGMGIRFLFGEVSHHPMALAEA
jgi:hypothetical protein